MSQWGLKCQINFRYYLNGSSTEKLSSFISSSGQFHQCFTWELYVQKSFGSFFYLHVTREKLLKRRSYEKFVQKTLMKLTPAVLFLFCFHTYLYDYPDNILRSKLIDLFVCFWFSLKMKHSQSDINLFYFFTFSVRWGK